MGVKWTKEQKQAIDEKGQNILVAAAAGSGKTAVLVERIISKIIKDNVDIDKLLVVTFTNAAASEMRERVLEAIYKKLEEDQENENLQKQIILLNKSNICTIDSFCLEIVKNNFFELDGVSPNFKIADSDEMKLLKQDILEELFEKKYEEEDADFEILIKTYTTYRDDMPLKELILKIAEYIESAPFPERWLKEKINMYNMTEEILNQDFSENIWGENILKEVGEILSDSIVTLKNISKELMIDKELEVYYKIILGDIDKLSMMYTNLDNWDKTYDILLKNEFEKWSSKRVESDLKVYAKKVRDTVIKKIKKITDEYITCNSEEAYQDIQDMYEILKRLENIILEFRQEFNKRKRDRNMVDFSDVEHLALNLLVKEKEDGNIELTELAKTYQEKFQEIAIDEYQDSNLVQEYILTSVSKNNNIFMVGDVKQSIYKFRQAMPELFLTKYYNYKKKEELTAEDDLKIQLFKNFRSKQNVLDFTNQIFQNIMSTELGDIDYTEEEYLNLGANYGTIDQNEKIEIDILDIKEDEENEEEVRYTEEIGNESEENKENDLMEKENLEKVEIEAKYVANRIRKLIKEKYQVWDRKKEEYRNITYKDIVILLRAPRTPAPVFEQEIIKLDIPVFSDMSGEYLDTIEIQTIINLLKIIDNPIQDIPLIAVLKSNIGKFTDNDLVEIRLSDKYDNFYNTLIKAKIDVNEQLKLKIEKFLENLEKWRKEKDYLALDELIWKIYLDTSFYHYVGLMTNGILRQANLKMLFEKAKRFENTSFKGLYNFISFIEKTKISVGDTQAAKIIGENDDVVRIMSIHKSKGLEFPVVFLCNATKQFNEEDLKKSLILHQDLGIGGKYIDYEKQIKYDAISKIAIKNKVKVENISEEMRVLYVALTRAKEKLIVTGTVKDYEKKIGNILDQIEIYKKEDKINPILVKKYKTYMDWMLLVYNYQKHIMSDYTNINILNKKEIFNTFEKTVENDEEWVFTDKEINKQKVDELNEIFNTKYKYENELNIPTKTSVTKIKELSLEKESNIKKTISIEELKGKDSLSNKESIFIKPKFLSKDEQRKITKAEIGTLVHLCMQKLDINIHYDIGKIEELIKDLVAKDIISSQEAVHINKFKILEFTKSNLWKDMCNSKEIYQEKPFYINIPVSEIYVNDESKKESQEDVLVQGIIDLYYINDKDEIVLVDYKTDYVENNNENSLVEKYKIQLDLYKKALESALGRKVSKTYIYSVYLGKEIEI